MKIGIDSYCYHRCFGEVYDHQRRCARAMTVEGFIDRAHELGVDGVSLESCFIPGRADHGHLAELKSRLDGRGLDRVYAWGHPDGLERGASPAAFADLLAEIPRARMIGATVMRIVGSSLRWRGEDHQPQLRALAVQLRAAVRVAADHGVRLAIENHIDFTAREILQLITAVDSPHLGVNFDTGNFARLLDDPLKAMALLAPHTLATHIKDLRVDATAACDSWRFLAAVPVGQGFIDNLRLARLLAAAGYRGFLALEIDALHPDCGEDEDAAVVAGVAGLRALARAVADGVGPAPVHDMPASASTIPTADLLPR